MDPSTVSYCAYCGFARAKDEHHDCPAQRAESAAHAHVEPVEPAKPRRRSTRGGVRYCRYCGKQLSDRSALWKHEGGRDRDMPGSAVCQRQRLLVERPSPSSSPSPPATPLQTPPSTPAMRRTTPPKASRTSSIASSSSLGFQQVHPAASFPSIFAMEQAYYMEGYNTASESTFTADPPAFQQQSMFQGEPLYQEPTGYPQDLPLDMDMDYDLDYEYSYDDQYEPAADAYYGEYPAPQEQMQQWQPDSGLLLHTGVPHLVAGYY